MAEITLSSQFTSQGKRGAASPTSSQWKQAQPSLFVLPRGDTRWQQLKWQQEKALWQPAGHQWLGPPVVGDTWPSRLPSLPRRPGGCHGAQHLVQWGTDVEMKSPVPWLSCFSIISCFSLRWLAHFWLARFVPEASLPALKWQLFPNYCDRRLSTSLLFWLRLWSWMG